METSAVRKRILDVMNAAKRDAAERRSRNAEAGAAYEKFRLAMGAAPRPPAQRRAGMEESAHH